MMQPKLSTWRLVREVYTYEGARIWWLNRNRALNGKRPCESSKHEVDWLLDVLIDGAF